MERGPRCICGHYESEHEAPHGCHGVYGTLMADADDFESVEVRCHCRIFYKADHEFEVRS